MPGTPGTELVIFDCDGVLVDSETLSNQLLRDVIAELGWELTLDEVFSRFKGRSIVDIWATVGRRIGRQVTPEEGEAFRSRQQVLFEAKLTAVPGADALLRNLELPFCVASNAPHEKLRVVLGATGLWDAVEGRVFSRADVSRPKPFPDLFLHAAQTLGAAVEHSVVIEDSPLGVTAALAAGMRVLGFHGTATADPRALRAAGAHAVFDRLEELPALL